MKKSQASIIFIVITILLDAIGIGIIIPILPDVIRRFGTDSDFVSTYFGYFISVYALMQFLASPLLGSLSDRFGRRPVLLVSLLGAGLDYILMAFAGSMPLLFIGRVISGLTGASMTVASSYMADISNDTNRTANFGLIGASFGVGFIVGPVLGGFVGSFGHQYPFLLASVLSLSNFFFGLFVLPESLPENKRRKVDLHRMNPFKSLGKILFKSPMVIFIWMYLLINLAGHSHPSIWTLYTQYKFKWTSMQVGLSLAAVGVSFGIGQGFTTRLLVPRLGEMKSVIIGTSLHVASYIAYALITQGWMVYVAISLFTLVGITMPSLQTLISQKTPTEEQGELQGSLVSIGSLTAVIGPLFYTKLFSHFTSAESSINFPGAPYIAAAFFAGICFILALISRKKIIEPSI
jgi:DHA1 family tetracycline resistance protein-like MFS transporter